MKYIMMFCRAIIHQLAMEDLLKPGIQHTDMFSVIMIIKKLEQG